MFKVVLTVRLQMLLILHYSDGPIAPLAAVDYHVAQHTHCDLAWTLEVIAAHITQSSGFTARTGRCTTTLY